MSKLTNQIFRLAYNKDTGEVIGYYPVMQDSIPTDYRINDECDYIDTPYIDFASKLYEGKPSGVDLSTLEITFQPYTPEEFEEYITPFVEDKRIMIDSLIVSTDIYMATYKEETELLSHGLIPSATLSEEQYSELLMYRYALRNMAFLTNTELNNAELPIIPSFM